MKRMTLSEYLAVRKITGEYGLPNDGHSRLGKLEKKPHGKTYPDGI